jgi:hypothetical protein
LFGYHEHPHLDELNGKHFFAQDRVGNEPVHMAVALAYGQLRATAFF